MSEKNNRPARDELLLAAKTLEAAGIEFFIDCSLSVAADTAVEYVFDKDGAIAKCYGLTVEQLGEYREYEDNCQSLRCCGNNVTGKRCGKYVSADGLNPEAFARKITVFCHLHAQGRKKVSVG